MRKLAAVMSAAAVMAIGFALAASTKSQPVANSATLKVTCMSDGSMRIDSDAISAPKR